jgi:hypothetical protein
MPITNLSQKYLWNKYQQALYTLHPSKTMALDNTLGTELYQAGYSRQKTAGKSNKDIGTILSSCSCQRLTRYWRVHPGDRVCVSYLCM